LFDGTNRSNRQPGELARIAATVSHAARSNASSGSECDEVDCRIAGLPDCRIAGLPDCRIAGLQNVHPVCGGVKRFLNGCFAACM
jgi:hypothetical protein